MGSVLVGLAGVAAIVAYAVVFNFIIDRLRREHEEAWTRLGKPTLFVRRPRIGRGSLTHFIFTSEYTRLGDPKLARLVWCARILFPLALAFIFVQFAMRHAWGM